MDINTPGNKDPYAWACLEFGITATDLKMALRNEIKMVDNAEMSWSKILELIMEKLYEGRLIKINGKSHGRE